ncbi:DUF2259 domain-containing protein [Spirochaetia bacterium 38H-sp]|uniref:DUF2259 domain-containing protein n=1 Tax=Rarispira pelagica TaxID=3141764 RepID=A0ABU9U9B8_9SPIR
MKKTLIPLVLLLAIFSLYAGDAASFVNLGFSGDGNTFMFGIHGITQKDSYPYAEMYVVDVADNDFVPAGVKKKTYPVSFLPGQDSVAALLNLLEDNISLTKKYGIDHLNQGRLLYILANGAEPKDYIEFRDFYTSEEYHVTLVQTKKGSKESSQASFHIQLTKIDKSKNSITAVIGLPNYFRKGVMEYRIRQIILAPDNASLVFVVEKYYYDTDGPTIKYMVETYTP